MPESSLHMNTDHYPATEAKSPFCLAAPSFVRPGTIAENCAFLADKVDEVGLVFFETKACLAYNENDLPPWLPNLDLSYHVHLPLDLPWSQGVDAVFAVIATLAAKVSYLSPTTWVLHPHPLAPPALLEARFTKLGINPANVLLENIKECDLTEIWDKILKTSLSICLDIGHVLAYSQHTVTQLPDLWKRVRMLHAYAPDLRYPSRHSSLALLDQQGRKLLQHALKSLRSDAVVNLEIFNEDGLISSLSYYKKITAR